MMCNYTFFSRDPSQRDESYQSLWGCHDICPLLKQFHVTQVTHPGLSSLTHLWVWGDFQRFCDMVFLLILPKEGVVGERAYGLSVVWVHPCQVWVPTLDEVVRKLALLASSSSNWPYALVHFSGDAPHVPLLKEVHLSAMTDRMHSNIPCGQICLLEAHQL